MTATDPDPTSDVLTGEIESAELHSAEATAPPDEAAEHAMRQVDAASNELENASVGFTDSDLESVSAALDEIESEAQSENGADTADADLNPDENRVAVNNVRELDTVLAADIESVLQDEGDPFGTTQQIEISTEAPEISESATDGSSTAQGNANGETASSHTDIDPPSVLPADESPQESSVAAGGIRAQIEAIAHAVLVRLNAPLKLIPESKRKYVDWIALSLALWVPIVWLIAFLTRG